MDPQFITHLETEALSLLILLKQDSPLLDLIDKIVHKWNSKNLILVGQMMVLLDFTIHNPGLMVHRSLIVLLVSMVPHNMTICLDLKHQEDPCKLHFWVVDILKFRTDHNPCCLNLPKMLQFILPLVDLEAQLLATLVVLEAHMQMNLKIREAQPPILSLDQGFQPLFSLTTQIETCHPVKIKEALMLSHLVYPPGLLNNLSP